MSAIYSNAPHVLHSLSFSASVLYLQRKPMIWGEEEAGASKQTLLLPVLFLDTKAISSGVRSAAGSPGTPQGLRASRRAGPAGSWGSSTRGCSGRQRDEEEEKENNRERKQALQNKNSRNHQQSKKHSGEAPGVVAHFLRLITDTAAQKVTENGKFVSVGELDPVQRMMRGHTTHVNFLVLPKEGADREQQHQRMRFFSQPSLHPAQAPVPRSKSSAVPPAPTSTAFRASDPHVPATLHKKKRLFIPSHNVIVKCISNCSVTLNN